VDRGDDEGSGIGIDVGLWFRGILGAVSCNLKPRGRGEGSGWETGNGGYSCVAGEG
jgi:hypothetical protein